MDEEARRKQEEKEFKKAIRVLNNLYSHLYDDLIKQARYNGDKSSIIKEYLDRKEKMISLLKERAEQIQNEAERRLFIDGSRKFILDLYFNQYVIKEENIKELSDGKTKKGIIEAQKARLEMWINYLIDAPYPMWVKYWAFQGMVRMGAYNEVTGDYNQRTENTVQNFPYLDPIVIKNTMDTIMKLVKGETIDEETELRLDKTGSFRTIFTAFEKKRKRDLISNSKASDGIWVMYHQGSFEDAKKLSTSIATYGAGVKWCVADLEIASNHICGPLGDLHGHNINGGDFYVYYTKDENGNYVIPRIAIRCIDHDKIAEIRGVEEGQNLEDELLDILELKLKSIPGLKESHLNYNLNIINNIRKIISICNKILSGEELSKDEKTFFTNSNLGEYYFGLTPDKRSNELGQILAHGALDTDSFDRQVELIGLNKAHSVNNKEVIKQAIKKDISHLEYATLELLSDYDLISYAIEINGMAIKFCSDKFMKEHKDLVVKAIEKEPSSIEFVPVSLLEENPDLVRYAANSKISVMRLISTAYFKKHPDLVLEILNRDPNVIATMPDELLIEHAEKTIEIAKSLIFYIEELPEELMDKYPYIISYQSEDSPSRLRNVSLSFQLRHPGIILDVLLANYNNIRYVDKYFITRYPEIMGFVLFNNPDALDCYNENINWMHSVIPEKEAEFSREKAIKIADNYKKKYDSSESIPSFLKLIPNIEELSKDYVMRKIRKQAVRKAKFRKLKGVAKHIFELDGEDSLDSSVVGLKK